MKTIKSLFAVLFALLAFSACEKDGDKYICRAWKAIT